jgi:hypothetical protein
VLGLRLPLNRGTQLRIKPHRNLLAATVLISHRSTFK